VRAAPRRPALAVGLLALALAAAAEARPLAAAVESVGFTVADVERSARFFTEVLAFEPVADVEASGEAWERLQGLFNVRMRVVRLRLGEERLELTEYLAPAGRPIPADARSNDRSFQHVAIVVSDLDAAYRRLRAHRVAHVSAGPQRLPDWNPAAGGIRAFYFRDPDGHVLELIEFPPGKGDPRWQRRDGRLFLGIDHTAIVVADTEASLAFYRDLLGLRVAGTSENHGPEQERLNGVFAVRLRITALRAAAGPGIELLEYLTPRDGRPMPPDLRASDLLHWQTRLLTADAAGAEGRLRRARALFVSPGTVGLPEPALGFRAGLTVRDPDGHAIQLAAGGGR
jgi:catechol 2,3-dioxygenase-like lactoylglutathione lyase family enzyme